MPPRAPSVPPAYPRADPRAADGVAWTIRLGATGRLCETLSSWRLLVGGLSPGASHHSFTTSSEEPPLSNFNSYRDIPSDLNGTTGRIELPSRIRADPGARTLQELSGRWADWHV